MLLALLAAGPAAAECRVALSLGVDVSSSVDTEEYGLQVEGLARALEAPEVAAAFLGDPERPVWLHVYEWSGRGQQVVKLDWMAIRRGDDLGRAAAALRSGGRSFANFPTALGEAMVFGARVLRSGPVCDAAKLDLSGDGTSNDGISPTEALRVVDFEGITVNGLVIGPSHDPLARYYERFVIHGPDAFVEEAQGYGDFERAMRRKLVRELRPAPMSALP